MDGSKRMHVRFGREKTAPVRSVTKEICFVGSGGRGLVVVLSGLFVLRRCCGSEPRMRNALQLWLLVLV